MTPAEINALEARLRDCRLPVMTQAADAIRELRAEIKDLLMQSLSDFGQLQEAVEAGESFQKDAARYRWLRLHRPNDWKLMPAETLDECVDAEIEANP